MHTRRHARADPRPLARGRAGRATCAAVSARRLGLEGGGSYRGAGCRAGKTAAEIVAERVCRGSEQNRGGRIQQAPIGLHFVIAPTR
jgi:hypothetical protein